MKSTKLGHLLLLIWIFSALASFAQETKNEIQTFAEDGAWCWFSDPRAVFYHDQHERTYIGMVSSKGDVKVAQYDHQTGKTQEIVVDPDFQADDHVNPSLLVLPDGHLMLFYTGHNGGFYYTKTQKPENINKWHKVKELDLGSGLCYTNPVMLEEENNRIYVFSRGGYDWKPSYIYSDDLGESWSKPQSIVSKPGAENDNRPYTKVVSDRKKRIWFAVTDGHPRNEPLNSIYVFYFENGQFYQPDGRPLGKISELPLDMTQISPAYDARQTKARAWIWDIATDKKNNPVIVYTRLKEETRHLYYYAKWNGEKWEHSFVAEGGKDFPREERTKGERNPEPHYSGGIVLDHANPGTVYFSQPLNDRFEIFRASKQKEEWEKKQITHNSENDNVRPFVVRQHSKLGKEPMLLWMQNKYYRHYTDFKTSIRGMISP